MTNPLCTKCGGEADFVKRNGPIAMYRCSRCGEEISGILEERPEQQDDPYQDVYAVLTGGGEVATAVLGLRKLVPALQDVPVAGLVERMRSRTRITVGKMRRSMMNELNGRASGEGVNVRFECRQG